MALRISLVVCLASALSFLHLKQTLTKQTIIQLEDYIVERGRLESQIFVLAESNHKVMRAHLSELLGRSQPDNPDYRRFWEQRGDGSIRGVTAANDKDLGLFHSNLVGITPELEARLAVLPQFTTSYGQAYREQFINTYVSTPENSIALFWPATDFLNKQPADFDMRKEEYVYVASPDHDRERKTVWTGTYYDTNASLWMVSVATPVDLHGKWLATIGNDVLLNDILERAVSRHLPGATNIIFRDDGRLISHPQLLAEIRDSAGHFNLAQAQDPRLRQLYTAVRANSNSSTSGQVVVHPAGDALLAAHLITGPNWYFVVEYPKHLITSSALSAAKFVFALGVASLLAELVMLYWILRRRIALPLQALTRGTDAVAHGDLNVELDVVRRDELGALAESFNSMSRAVAERDQRLESYANSLEQTVQHRTLELEARHAQLRTVLDHVEQGLVAIDRQGNMSAERSTALDAWFGPVPETLKFSEYLGQHDSKFRERFDVGFAEVLDGVLPLELALDQLAHRLDSPPRSFELSYVPVFQHGLLDKLLVIITDVSVRLDREKAEGVQKDLLGFLERFATDRQGFIDFYQEASEIILALSGAEELTTSVRARLIHTLKGNAHLFGLRSVARLCHTLETQSEADGETQQADLDALLDAWRVLDTRLRVVLDMRDLETLRVPRSDYDRVVEQLAQEPALEAVLRQVQSWGLDPVAARLQRLAEHAEALAVRLGKPVPRVMIDAGGLLLDGPHWSSFWPSCVHFIRNAVDHGIELPELRAKRGKPETGCISLSAAADGLAFVITLQDDGAGVDWERIAQKARARGLDAATPGALVEALFADGVSCRDSVGEISGFGIGMGALRAEVELRGGKVSVISTAGQGTTLTLRFPRSEMVPAKKPKDLASAERTADQGAALVSSYWLNFGRAKGGEPSAALAPRKLS